VSRLSSPKRHPAPAQLELYSLDRLHDPILAQVEEHLLVCEFCREVVAENDRLLHALRVLRIPMSFVHQTEDGPICSHVARLDERTWFARHWGRELHGGRSFESILDANEYLLNSFAEMFPEHECGPGCRSLDIDREQ
jgi:hypothetical protein